MIRKRPKNVIPLRKFPGEQESEYCSPGSIEQELDMCEEGSLKGEEVERRVDLKATPSEPKSGDPLEITDEMDTFEMTMAERDREGDEMSGDDHSSGLQGGEAEIMNQRHIDSGIPGSFDDGSNGLPAQKMEIRRAEHKKKRKAN